jgi:hypothetical protein
VQLGLKVVDLALGSN